MEHLMDFVEVNNKWYYVSTNFTFDNGLETMVFPANEENEVTDCLNYIKSYMTI